MDHQTAVKIQAAERYVLEEFPPEERAEFEEHFFDCPECAEEVRSASVFAANAKAVLREERERQWARLSQPADRPRWRFWAPLAASAALNLALLVGFGLERAQLHRAEASTEPQFYQTVAVAPASRGSQSAVALRAGAKFFALRFDITPGHDFQSFEYQILDPQGAVRLAKSVAAPGWDSELQLSVPIWTLGPGDYTVVVRGQQGEAFTEIGRRGFSIPR